MIGLLLVICAIAVHQLEVIIVKQYGNMYYSMFNNSYNL